MLFRRRLADAGGQNDTVSAICAYAATIPMAEISNAIDLLGNEDTRREEGVRLSRLANEWAAKQSDMPADTEGLPPADETEIEDDSAIPF